MFFFEWMYGLTLCKQWRSRKCSASAHRTWQWYICSGLCVTWTNAWEKYILEYENFLIEAKRAGLMPEKKHEHLFPNKEIPIVSVNRLICK